MKPDFAIRYAYYETLSYRKWQAQFVRAVGDICWIYYADCKRGALGPTEALRRLMQDGR